jgi:hypothetical protein
MVRHPHIVHVCDQQRSCMGVGMGWPHPHVHRTMCMAHHVQPQPYSVRAQHATYYQYAPCCVACP